MINNERVLLRALSECLNEKSIRCFIEDGDLLNKDRLVIVSNKGVFYITVSDFTFCNLSVFYELKQYEGKQFCATTFCRTIVWKGSVDYKDIIEECLKRGLNND